MKRYIWMSLVLGLLFFSCNRKSQQVRIPTTAQVNLVEEVRYKTLDVRSVGYGKSSNDAIRNAEINSFDILLFRGIPQSAYERPMVGTLEKDIKSDNSGYFGPFYKNRYKSFMTHSYDAVPVQKQKGGYYVAVRNVGINVLSLKSDLEANKVIRKFGL